MDGLQIFKNDEFGEIRITMINGKEYFYGIDIANALGYERPSKAISDNCKGVLTKDTIKNKGGYPEKLITEGDLYRLIVKSKLKSAVKFETWVFDEILPIIRKTGGYVNNDELFINTYLNGVDDDIKQLFRLNLTVLKQKDEIIRKQREEIEYKEDVIIGLIDEITLADKRQILNRVVRHNHANYQLRWSILYKEFEAKYHCNIQQRLDSYNRINKPKCTNKVDYIETVMKKLPELYEIATKLFHTDIEELQAQLYRIK